MGGLIDKLKSPLSPMWRIPAYLMLGAAVAAAIFSGWLNHYRSVGVENAPVAVWRVARPSGPVAGVPKVKTAVKGGAIKTYPASVKNNLRLPPVIRDDPAQQVVAATTAQPDDHPQTVTTTVNTDTGETETIIRREPLPWLAWSDRGGAAMYAGIKNGEPTIRMHLHQELFSVKAVHFGAVASVDQPINGPIGADYFIGIGGEYRW